MISLRCSELDRVLACPGSLTLVPMVRKRQGGEGWEGVMLHWLIAARLIAEFGATPPDGGLPGPDVPKGYKLPAFSSWIVDWAIRHVRETIPDKWSLLVEVPLAYQYSRFILSAHIDVMGISPDATESIGIDWKTGRDPVDQADNNEQVAGYLCNAKRAWETLTKNTFQIAQPRADEESGFERVSTVVVENLDALVASMDSRICAAIDNDHELNTGLKQCKYCIGCSCPAIRAEQKLMKMKLTPELLATIRDTPDDAMLGDFVLTSRLLEKPAKDAAELLHARLDKVTSITSGEGRVISRKLRPGHYTVPDPVKFFSKVRGLLQTDERIARAYTPSMTRIKDEIAAAMDLPKTSKIGNSAELVFDGHLRPDVEQGDTRILVIT